MYTKWGLDELANGPNGNWTKWLLDEMVIRRNEPRLTGFGPNEFRLNGIGPNGFRPNGDCPNYV